MRRRRRAEREHLSQVAGAHPLGSGRATRASCVPALVQAPDPAREGTEDSRDALGRLEHIARAERRAELDEDWPLYTTAVTLRCCVAREWERLTGRTITGITIPPEAIPTSEQAAAIIAAEADLQDAIGKQRHLASAERQDSQLAQLAAEAPAMWGEQAHQHHAYVENFRRAMVCPRGRTRGQRPRVARMQRRSCQARRETRTRSSARSGDSPGGGDPPGGDDPEGEHHLAPGASLSPFLAGRDRLLVDILARVGWST